MTEPIWAAQFGRVLAALDGRGGNGSRPPRPPLDGVGTALPRAVECLHEALGREPSASGHPPTDVLTSRASALLSWVASVWSLVEKQPDDPSSRVAGALAGQLRGHEADVLAGELTYAVDAGDAEEPSAGAQRALALLERPGTAGFGDALSLQTAAVQIAALLVRAAANLAVAGVAGGAVSQIGGSLTPDLRDIVSEIEQQASVARETGGVGRDTVGHHLSAALRTEVPAGALAALERPGADIGTLDVVGAARVAWVALASREHVVTKALDAELGEPSYAKRFGTLENAIVQGAANLLGGARLVERPEAFRHHKAWGNQAVVLSHAIEAYIGGLRGQQGAFEQAQLIVLTRLLRAVAAVQLLDLRRRTDP